MLVIRVELWSAVTGVKTEIARMMIHNRGGTRTRGDYGVEVYRGRDEATLHKAMVGGKPFKEGLVTSHPRLSEHVWNLVGKALRSTGYDKSSEPDPMDAP